MSFVLNNMYKENDNMENHHEILKLKKIKNNNKKLI